MTDVWMVESPNKTRVTFVIRGDEKSGSCIPYTRRKPSCSRPRHWLNA
jgi:hypothetical protein